MGCGLYCATLFHGASRERRRADTGKGTSPIFLKTIISIRFAYFPGSGFLVAVVVGTSRAHSSASATDSTSLHFAVPRILATLGPPLSCFSRGWSGSFRLALWTEAPISAGTVRRAAPAVVRRQFPTTRGGEFRGSTGCTARGCESSRVAEQFPGSQEGQSTSDQILSELDIFISSKGNFIFITLVEHSGVHAASGGQLFFCYLFPLVHMKNMINKAIVRDIGHFDGAID